MLNQSLSKMSFHGGMFSFFYSSYFIYSKKYFRFKNAKINHLVVSNNVFILHLNEKTLQRRCLEEMPKDGKTPQTFPGLIFSTFKIYVKIMIFG